MDVSIKRRIYWSFTLLVSLFVINGIITIITLNNNKKLSRNITTIIDPSLESIENFKDMLVASRMYSTNWVFLRSNQEDKDALKRLHNIEYPRLKVKLNHLSAEWNNKQMADSLNKVLTWFEQVLVVEKGIMSSLQKFDDYDDPVAKLEAERLVEDELLPVTSYLMDGLQGIVSYEVTIKNQKNKDLEESSMRLRLLISVLAITIIFIGIFLSLYMARVIISPIKKIRHIVNDLGKGIISQVNHKSARDEIGDMVCSVNNLSEKLQTTAAFATAVGNRNFESYFEPLSSEDTLGKALIAMRDNIKSSYQKLNEAQQIAKLGSWERDIKNDHVSLSDELFRIFEIDPVSFDSRFQSILELIHKEDIESFKDIGRKYMLDHQPAAYEIRIFTAKGNTKNVSIQSKVVLDVNGEVIKTIGIVQDITERKKAEIALLESQKQIQTIFDAALDAIIIIDEEGKIVKWDSKAETLFGWKQEEVLDTSLTETIIPHEHREAHARGMKHFLKTGEGPVLGKTIEVRALNKNNDEFDISLSISPSLINNKYQFIGFIRDITERKKAEEALGESEKRLRQIIDLVPHFIFAKDIKGKFILANEALARNYGSAAQDLIGKSDADFNPKKEEVEHFINEDLEVINSGKAKYNIEETITDIDGNIQILSTTKIPYTFVGSDIPGVLGVSVNISERIKAETVLKQSEGQLSIATQIAKLGYWEFDVKSGLFTFNDQFYSIFKTTAEEVGGYTMSGERFIDLFVYPDDRTAVYTEGTNAITSKNPHISHQFEYRGLYANGEMGHMVNCYFIVKDDQGHTIKTFGANQDITERKKGEETLRRSEATLELKNKELEQKNKELEQFAYVASHDLQEPLSTTSGFADLLQKEFSANLDEKANKYLGFITHSTDRMKVLIKDLLDYSRIGRHKELEQVDCNILLSEVLEDLNKLITDENAIIQTLQLPVISGFPTEIQQLFKNLIMNAIKFRKKTLDPKIKISAQLIQGNWQFSFKDNGIGIEEQHTERIFVIFQRLYTRGEYKGSGIGLSHCKKIVELHGGKIWVNSTPGEGSTFNFTLPVTPADLNYGKTNVPGMYIDIHENNMKLNTN